MKNQPYKYIVFPALLILVNFLVKGLFLSHNSLGGDEPFSVYHAQMDVASIIKLLSTGNNPPLYEILLHFWIKLFGLSEFSVRLPSLVFSSITVWFIYKLGVKHLNIKVAVYSCLFFILSNYHISFAHEARVYSLLGMLSVMSMYYFLELLNAGNSFSGHNLKLFLAQPLLRKYLCYLTVNTLLIYSHYFGFFVLIAQFLFVLVSKKLLTTYWKELLATIFLLAIFYLPNTHVFFNRFVDSSTNGTWVSPPNGLGNMYDMLRAFANAPVVTVAVCAIFMIAGILYVFNYKKQDVGIPGKLIAFWFVFVFFFMFGISYLIPMFLDRYLMTAAIAFCILIGISADYINQQIGYKNIVPVLAMLLFAFTVKPNISNKRNVKETVERVKQLRKDNTLVLICPKGFILNFSYYYDINIFKKHDVSNIYAKIDSALKTRNIYGINHIDEIDFKKWNRIVYLDAAADFSYPGNNILNQLNKDYVQVNKFEYYEIFKIYEYDLK